jgi:hypothetical protein
VAQKLAGEVRQRGEPGVLRIKDLRSGAGEALVPVAKIPVEAFGSHSVSTPSLDSREFHVSRGDRPSPWTTSRITATFTTASPTWSGWRPDSVSSRSSVREIESHSYKTRWAHYLTEDKFTVGVLVFFKNAVEEGQFRKLIVPRHFQPPARGTGPVGAVVRMSSVLFNAAFLVLLLLVACYDEAGLRAVFALFMYATPLGLRLRLSHHPAGYWNEDFRGHLRRS